MYYATLLLFSTFFQFNNASDTMSLQHVADSLYVVAKGHFGAYEYEKAIDRYNEALVAEFVLNRKKQVAALLYDIGEAYYELCVYDSAFTFFDSALVHAREIGNREIECQALIGRGQTHEVLSQPDQAMECYDSALVLARQIEDRHFEGVVLCNVGWTYDARSDYEKALAYHDSALVVAREIFDRKLEARVLRRIGTAYSVLGQYERALAYYDSALVIAQELEDQKLEGRTLMGIGRVQCAFGEYEKALSISSSALEMMKATNDLFSQSYVLDCAGMAYRFLGRYDSALAKHEAALTIRKKLGDKVGEGNSLINIGLTYDDLYRYEEALCYLDSALIISKTVGNRSAVETIFISVGAIYDQLARYERALIYYDSALAVARETGEEMREGSILMYIGGIYHNLKQYDKALVYYDSAHSVIKPLNIAYTDGLISIYVGAAYRALGNYEDALSVYDSALLKMRAIKNRRMEGVTLHNMGCAYYNLEQYDKALAYFDSAIVLADETINMFRKALILSHMGAVFRVQEQYAKALAHYESSLSVADKIKDRNTKGATFREIGQLYEQMADLEKAISYYKQSIEVIESIRTGFRREELKAYYIEAEQDVYERLINLLIILERYKEAFDYMERSHSEKIRRTLEEQDVVAYDPSLRRILERIDYVKAEIEGLNIRFRRKEIKGAEFDSEMAELEGKLNQRLFDLKAYYPQYYNVMVPQIPSLELVQQAIPENTVFLEYMPAGDAYTTFIFGREIFLTKSLGKSRAYIDSIVLTALTDLKWLADRPTIDDHMRHLFTLLLGPVEHVIKDYLNVVIIPYGMLHYVPYHALRRMTKEGDFEYLVDWKSVSYLPSAQFLRDLLQTKEPSENELLAFANCDGTLPSAEVEVDSICKIFPDACICKKDSATKERFLNVCGDFKFIHLATHGLLDPDARFSQLVLAPSGDGNLTVREIVGLAGCFRYTSLVTLSACETAVEEEPETAGMELTTLAIAFKMAGVSSTVATLWEIADRSTAILMKDFYRGLRQGVSKIESLRKAQIAMQKHADYAHPYYWAPFVLIGDWR